MTKRLAVMFAVAVAVGGTSPVAHAVDSKTFGCESAVVLELANFSKGRGACLQKCVSKKESTPGTYTCHPPTFQPDTTVNCLTKGVDKYYAKIAKKCTGYMPLCGGYLKNYCSNNPTQECNRHSECNLDTCNLGFCMLQPSVPCSANIECNGSCDAGHCTGATGTGCYDDGDCSGTGPCLFSSTPQDIPVFSFDNLFGGVPSPTGQIDGFVESEFQCRQSVCTSTGALCRLDTACGAGTCQAGKCKAPATNYCRYDGDCSTKKCLPLGRCSDTAQPCTVGVPGECPGVETCERYGRCDSGDREALSCFNLADCPNGTACVKTAVSNDRKAEVTCTKAVSAALASYTVAISKCQTACAKERDPKLGQRCQSDTSRKCKVDADCTLYGGGPCRKTSCDPFAIGRCASNLNQVCKVASDCLGVGGGACTDTTPDPASQKVKDCRAKALTKALATMNKKCAAMPLCGAFSQFGVGILNKNTPDDLIGFVSEFQDKQFKEDNPDLEAGQNFCAP